MPDLLSLETLQALLAKVTDGAGNLSATISLAKTYIREHFGANGLLAAYGATAVFALLLLYQLMRITWMAIKYVAIPSIALAYLASFVMPYPFASVLPVTVALCSLVMLFKG